MSESELNNLNVSISAVVVVYNDYQSLDIITKSLRGQVNEIVVIDNSDADYVAPENTINTTEIDYYRVGSNKGLGAGLNRGIYLSKTKGFDWVLLLDQDSVVSNDMVQCMLEEYDRWVEYDEIGLICPDVVLQEKNCHQSPLIFGKLLVTKLTETSDAADFAITSGSLIRVSILEKIGFMDERFFIDYIDYDFCFRLRSAGYKILYVNNAVLNHSLGERRVSNIGLMHTSHTSERVYYQTRNRLIVVSRYGVKFPAFALMQISLFVLKFFKILLLEDQKLRRLRYYFAGVYDFLRKRYLQV